MYKFTKEELTPEWHEKNQEYLRKLLGDKMTQREFWLYNGDDETRTVFDAFDHILPDPPHIKPSYHVREVNPSLDEAIEGLVEALEASCWCGSNDPGIICEGCRAIEKYMNIKTNALASYKAALEEK